MERESIKRFKGTVTIDLEEYERLRSIETAIIEKNQFLFKLNNRIQAFIISKSLTFLEDFIVFSKDEGIAELHKINQELVEVIETLKMKIKDLTSNRD